MQRVLFADATEELRPLASALESAGFEVSSAPLEQVFETPGQSAPVVMLSLLGRGDASAARAVMRSSSRPHQTAVIAVVRPEQLPTLDFTLGFDDFVVHPALDEEVVARVRHAIWMKSGVGSDNTLRVGDLVIDLSNYKVYVSGRPVDLTYKEYELLRFLATNRDKVFTREALLNRVWGYDFYGGARTVDVHVRRLRSKIEDASHTFIETVRNVGYRFVSR